MRTQRDGLLNLVQNLIRTEEKLTKRNENGDKNRENTTQPRFMQHAKIE